MKLSSWPEIGSDGDVLLMRYVPKGITGYDDDDVLTFTFNFKTKFYTCTSLSDKYYEKETCIYTRIIIIIIIPCYPFRDIGRQQNVAI